MFVDPSLVVLSLFGLLFGVLFYTACTACAEVEPAIGGGQQTDGEADSR